MTANDSILERANGYISGTFSLYPSLISHTPLSFDFDYNSQNSSCNHFMVALCPNLPNTMGFSEAQLFDTYAAYVERYGSKQASDALRDGKQVIIGLRIETNTRANQGKGLYDDRLAIIWQETPNQQPRPGYLPHGHMPQIQPHPGARNANQATVKHGVDFTANTEPSAYYEQPTTHVTQIRSKKTGKMIQVKVADKIIGPDGQEVESHPKKKWQGHDVNKDGRRDLGRLIPGTYKFYWGDKYLSAAALRPLGKQTVERDVNHDGVFNHDDIWHTDQGDVVIETGDNFGMLFHIGNRSSTASSGCQTLSPIEHARFFNTLKKQKEYYYVLVTLR